MDAAINFASTHTLPIPPIVHSPHHSPHRLSPQRSAKAVCTRAPPRDGLLCEALVSLLSVDAVLFDPGALDLGGAGGGGASAQLQADGSVRSGKLA